MNKATDPKKYRVAWESRVTGYKSHGEAMSCELAEIWARYGDITCPELRHWVEKCEADDQPQFLYPISYKPDML